MATDPFKPCDLKAVFAPASGGLPDRVEYVDYLVTGQIVGWTALNLEHPPTHNAPGLLEEAA